MLKISEFEVMGWEHAIRGMRNPMNSWDKSDSGVCKGGDNGIGCDHCANRDCEHTYNHSFQLGINDYNLMKRLRNAGTDHRKFMRMITVYLDITAPLYWWKEFDTYKVGTVANSCSTMHMIAEKEFTLEDFSTDQLCHNAFDISGIIDVFGDGDGKEMMAPIRIIEMTIEMLNAMRKQYLETKDKRYWWQMIQLLPSSYNQKRTVMLNYEVLANIYKSRRNHKLDEWHVLCDWIEDLPYSELITGYEEKVIDKFNSIGNINAVSPENIKFGIDLANGKDFTNSNDGKSF